MSQNARTGLLVVIGAVFLLIGWIARPAGPPQRAADDTGERFFEQFDPLVATSLEIISFDEDRGATTAFKVAQIDGVWSIPSHENYPADAEEQLAAAAASVADLTKGAVVSDSPADHELYGVMDPAAAEIGSSGVGMRVTLEDARGETLADFIIGNQVKDSPDLRYVRVPNQDRVYSVAVSTDELSTSFEDWIDRDLLQFDPADLRKVIINDYSIDEVNRRINQGETLQLNYDHDDRSWNVQSLGEDEALDSARLDELRRALDDLKIVDVVRKPEGLSRELRAEEQLALDAEALSSLRSRGYLVYEGQLRSNEGETIVGMASGVQYVMRFGEIALDTRAGSPADDSGDESAAAGNNRYLFVTAQFDQSLIDPPDLTPLPELPDEDGPALDQSPGQKNEPPAQTETETEADSDAQAGPADGGQPTTPSEPAGGPSTNPPADAKAVAESDGSGQEPADATRPQEEGGAAAPQPSDPGADEPAAGPRTDELIREARQRIEQENQAKRQEYQQQIEDGRETVRQLNDRFADWYYIISDDVYQKIRLSRSDIVEQVEPEESSDSPAKSGPPGADPATQPAGDAVGSEPS